MKKFIINIALASLTLLLVACSEESVKQDPPVKGMQLLMSMFADLQVKNYYAAKTQLDVYRAATTENPFFDTIEDNILANHAINQAQTQLDKGLAKEALDTLYNAKMVQPLNGDIDSAYQEVFNLVNAQELIAKIRQSESYDECLYNINKLKELVAENPDFAKLDKIVTASQTRLQELELKEQRLAQFNLLASAKDAKVKGEDELSELLKAEYQYEKKLNPKRELSNSGVEDVVIGQD